MNYIIQYKLIHAPNSQWINYDKFDNIKDAEIALENFKEQFPSFDVQIYKTI